MVEAHLRQSAALLERAAKDAFFLATIHSIIDLITTMYGRGGKLMLAGNGGSAADAQHIAGELVGRYRFDRQPLCALAITTDSSILTAIGNDYGYEHVFSRQIRAIGRRGDVFLGLSTSGRSPNVLAALRTARELGLATVGFTGSTQSPNPMRELSDHLLVAPTADTPLIQQVHLTVAHAICEAVESNLCSPPTSDSGFMGTAVLPN
jgi:D-sedoheptulose 7-phosphate isomerase